MSAISQTKGFTLVHQKVHLDVDFGKRRVQGWTQLDILPEKAIEKLSLNAQGLLIKSVFINEKSVHFTINDPLLDLETKPVVNGKGKSFKDLEEFRAAYSYALADGDEGELKISLPPLVQLEQPQSQFFPAYPRPLLTSDSEAQLSIGELEEIPTPTIESNLASASADMTYNDVQTPFSATTPFVVAPVAIGPSYEMISVKIVYESYKESSAGFNFTLPDKQNPNAFPTLTIHPRATTARCWVPCFDSMHSKSTFDLVLRFDRFAEDCVGELYRIPLSKGKRLEMRAVCSGEPADFAICQDEHGQASLRKLAVKYSISTPVSPISLLVAIGPFEIIEMNGWNGEHGVNMHHHGSNNHAIGTVPNDQPATQALAFCLPGQRKRTHITTSFLFRAFWFLQSYIGSEYPFGSFKLLFLPDPYSPVITGASLCIISEKFLVDQYQIEPVFETRRQLVDALCSQWFGHLLAHKSWLDEWVTIGLRGHLTSLFLATIFGKNEMLCRTHLAMEELYELDRCQPPLCPLPPTPKQGGFTLEKEEAIPESIIDPLLIQHYSFTDDPLSPRSRLLERKAPLVIYMLDKRLTKGSLLQKTLSKLFLSAYSNELPEGLSTHIFFKTLVRVSGKLELKRFADQWVYGSGVPRFTVVQAFNRRKVVIDIRIKQENSNAGMWGATEVFTGPITLQVHEPNGTYETEVFIDALEKNYELQYHTKYKRATKLKSLVGAGGAVEEPATQQEGEEVTAMTASAEIMQWITHFDDPNERLVFEWIRVDPDSEWVCVLQHMQDDFMWVNQFRRDLNAAAQSAAIRTISRKPSALACTLFFEALKDRALSYRVRLEAIKGLACCSTRDQGYNGAKILLNYYKERYCFPAFTYAATQEESWVSRSNDFSDFADYFVQKEIPHRLAMICRTIIVDEVMAADPDDISYQMKVSIIRFLLDLLKFNDNNGNTYSDSEFCSALLNAVTNAFLPSPPSLPTPSHARDSPNVAARDTRSHEVEELFSSYAPTTTFRPKLPSFMASLFESAASEVERQFSLDSMITTSDSSVTATCLTCLLKWMLCEYIPRDRSLFLRESRYGRPLIVRKAAIDALLLLDGMTHADTALYLFDILMKDKSFDVQYHTALSMSSVMHIASGPVMRVVADKAQNRSLDEHWKMVKSLFTGYLEQYWNALNASNMEHRRRVHFLKCCECLVDKASMIKLSLKMRMKPLSFASDSDYRLADRPNKPSRRRTVALTVEFLQSALGILEKLKAHPSAPPFLLPVDPAYAPFYDRIIRNPCDLSTVEQRLNEGYYANDLRDMVQDIQLIFSNCFTYNTDGSEVSDMARDLSAYFYQLEPIAALDLDADDLDEAEDSFAVPALSAVTKSARAAPVIQRMSMVDFRRCKSVLRKIKGYPGALWFTQPVDPILNQVPDYFDVIKCPMDLSTIQQKLDSAAYSGPDEFAADMRLIFANSLLYNPPEAQVNFDARKLSDVFEKEFFESSAPAVPDGKASAISVAALQKIHRVFRKLRSHPCTTLFWTPVDPVALGIPTYFDVIKRPMDLGTSIYKLERGKYSHPDEVYADIKLVFDNCCTFNPRDDFVYIFGKVSNLLFEEEWYKAFIAKEGHPPPTEMQAMILYLIHQLQMHEQSSIFLTPVDPMLLPHYYELISNPIDLWDIEAKARSGRYSSLTDLEKDIDLMLENCFRFNAPQDPVYLDGQSIQRFFRKELRRLTELAAMYAAVPAEPLRAPSQPVLSIPVVTQSPAVERPKLVIKTKPPKLMAIPVEKPVKAPPPSVPNSVKCLAILEKLFKQESSLIFRAPVDPAIYPDYYVKIASPISLQDINDKITKMDQEGTPYLMKDLDADMDLLFANCAQFNEAKSYACDQADKLRKFYRKERAAIEKRKFNAKTFEQSGASLQPAKKIKVTDSKSGASVKLEARPALPPIVIRNSFSAPAVSSASSSQPISAASTQQATPKLTLKLSKPAPPPPP